MGLHNYVNRRKPMKVELPHKNVNLDASLNPDAKMEIIFKLLDEEIVFHNETMTLEEYFRLTFEIQSSIIAMDIIGYYLTKENRVLEIMSTKKQEEMQKGSKRHVTFTSMGYVNQVRNGVIDSDDYQFN